MHICQHTILIFIIRGYKYVFYLRSLWKSALEKVEQANVNIITNVVMKLVFSE
jgi:hypothetical protein